jgi:hypothetical protein
MAEPQTSLTGQPVDTVRYRIGGRLNDYGVDHRAIIPGSENGDHGSSDETLLSIICAVILSSPILDCPHPVLRLSHAL